MTPTIERDERGQATIEFVVVLPVVVLAALVAVQAGLIARDQVLVVHAAREGARAAAVEPSEAAARDAVENSGIVSGGDVTVTVSGAHGAAAQPGDRLSVTVSRSPSAVPVVGRVLAGRRLEATVTVRVE